MISMSTLGISGRLVIQDVARMCVGGDKPGYGHGAELRLSPVFTVQIPDYCRSVGARPLIH